MFTINSKNYDIELTRGNSAEICVTPFLEETLTPYELQDGDKVLFTVTNNNGSRIYLQKVVTNRDYDDEHNLILKIKPEDTINMKAAAYYVYDLLLKTNDDAYTYVGRSSTRKIIPKFVLAEAYGDINYFNTNDENSDDISGGGQNE